VIKERLLTPRETFWSAGVDNIRRITEWVYPNALERRTNKMNDCHRNQRMTEMSVRDEGGRGRERERGGGLRTIKRSEASSGNAKPGLRALQGKCECRAGIRHST
jgi:hypothetical protein